MVWKLQEENEQLRESLAILVQSMEEDSGPTIKLVTTLNIICRKIKEATAEHVLNIAKEFAAKAKQKQWGLENKLKKSECQLRTMIIDSKTREQVKTFYKVLALDQRYFRS